MTDPDSVPGLLDSKAVNHLAEFPCYDVNSIKDFVGFKIFLLKSCCPENWEEDWFFCIHLKLYFKRNAKCLGTQRGKGCFKEKQTTAIKSQMANISPACGRAAWAVVWITKVWHIFCSVLICLSLPAFSFFGDASHIWTKMPFHDTVYSWDFHADFLFHADFHADFLFCFPPHFVYVLQRAVLIMFDGSLHHILYPVHGMPLCRNPRSDTGIYDLSLVLRDTYSSPSLPLWDPLKARGPSVRFLTHVASSAVA